MKCFNSTPKKQKIYKGTFQGEWESSPLWERTWKALSSKRFIFEQLPHSKCLKNLKKPTRMETGRCHCQLVVEVKF